MSQYVEQAIDETALVYSNIPDIVDLYDPATTYDVGEYCRVGSSVYKSTGTLNLGNPPLENLGVFWVYWSVSNAHAMFDLIEGTTTTWAGDGIIEFTRGSKDTLGIGNYTAVNVKVEYKDSLGAVILTENYATSRNQYVYDLWDYIYAPFTFRYPRAVFLPLKRIGATIRVTFQGGGSPTSCGYCVGGLSEEMGATLDQVPFTNRTIGSATASVANFTTTIDKKEVMDVAYAGKQRIGVPMMFVIDPALDSSHKNLVIIGKIKKCDAVAEVMSNNKIAWEIEQNVEV